MRIKIRTFKKEQEVSNDVVEVRDQEVQVDVEVMAIIEVGEVKDAITRMMTDLLRRLVKNQLGVVAEVVKGEEVENGVEEGVSAVAEVEKEEETETETVPKTISSDKKTRSEG